jgi:hypothetical protein
VREVLNPKKGDALRATSSHIVVFFGMALKGLIGPNEVIRTFIVAAGEGQERRRSMQTNCVY